MINRLFLLLGFLLIANIEILGQCVNTTNGGTVGGSATFCIASDPAAFTGPTYTAGGTGSIAHQWEKSTDNINWIEISGATGQAYNENSVINTTTYYRRKNKRTTCIAWSQYSNTLVVTILKSNAGPDQGKCSNTSFIMAANAAPTAPAGYAGTWSVISGTATIASINSPTSAVTLTSGTASLKWTLSNGTCTKADTVVLTNQTATVALSTPIVSSCINQPLQDIVTVDVNVSWTGSVPGAMINVIHNNKIEVINPATSTSPQTVRFLLPANNTSGKTISAVWNTNYCTPVSSSSFSVPAACSSDQLNCSILYLCGLDKPYDGDAFDHGLMEYITSVNGGTVTGALTKTDASGYGLYDLNNTTTLLPINLDNYGLIIISPTTEGHIAAGLVNALKGWKGSVLNMNYAIMQGLGYSTNNYVSWSSDGYINAVETLLNYDNPTSTIGKLVTLGDYYPTATAYIWKDASSKTANLGGVYFKYAPHTNTQISSTHGTRTYLGYHMNGIYGNASNGGALPAPVSSYFAPTKHLTQKGKEILDNALIASATCVQENCSNNIDDDGDGLADCLDPNCNNLTNGEFDNGTIGWEVSTQPGNTSVLTLDGTKPLSGQNAAKIETTVASGTEWHVQVSQYGKSIVAGEKYKISFRAKASSARNASVAMQLGGSPWTGYFYNTFALTTTSQVYSYEFTATATIANNISLLFNLASVTGTVWIDQVEFKKACPEPTLSCPSECPSPNQLVNGDFPLNVSGWTTNGVTEVGGGGTYGNFIVLNNANAAGPFTVYQDYAIGANKEYLFNGYAAKHGTTNNAKVYLEFYNGTTFISKTADFNVTKNYDGTFQAISPVLGFTPANTTKIRVVGWCAGTAIKLDELSLKVCVPKPTITSVTPGLVCVSGTVNLNATASAGVLNWYANPTGGTTLFTGTSFTTPIISSTTTYYVEAVNNGCYSASRTPVVATVSSCGEICTNGIDDDGDGLIDNADPDCVSPCNTNCVNPYTFNWFNGTTGNQWAITNGESTLQRVYPITGPAGTYNVTVTLNNPNGQNIDLSNCGTAGNHFYTGTCNDPNASFNCDGDVNTVDGQFNYGCNYLTYGITSNNSNEFVSITYTFDYPTKICGLEIGDIDSQGSGSGNADSWQDEIDVTASLNGVAKNIYATAGSGIALSGNNSQNLKLLSNYDNTSGGNIDPNDPNGHAFITTLSEVNSITFKYSNGPNDDGLSNDHAIRINGFSFCPPIPEICTNGIDDDLDGLIDCADSNCLPVITSVIPKSRCGTGPVALGATASTGTINWYAASTGGASLFTGTSFTTPSLSATTTYYVDATNGGCTSVRTAVVATISSCSENCTNGIDDDGDGYVDALDTDCNSCASIGQNLVINGEFDSGATGFSSDYVSTPIGSMCGNFGIYSVSNRISNVGAPNGCNNSIWSVADRANNGGNFMLIDPSQATGANDRIWAQSTPVCPNTDYVFSVWTKNMYYSEAPSYSGIDPNFQFKINGTILPSADFTMPRQSKADSLTWIKVQGIWNSGSSTSAILDIVNKVPGSLGNDLALDGIYFGLCGKTVSITAGVTSFCQGSSTNLAATAQTISSGWQFFEWVKDGVIVSSGTSTNYSATLAGTYKLRAYTTSNNSGCPQESNAIVLSTIAGPSISNVTPSSRCGTGTVTLGATASAGTINWYVASSGGASLFTGTSFTTPSLSATTTYYVDATNGGCTSARTPVVANVTPIPGAKIIQSASRCGPGTVTLQVLFGSGNSNWYDAPTGGNLVGTGNSFTTPVLNTTTTYYIEGELNGCVSASRQAITATINPLPTISLNGPSAICINSNTSVTTSVSGGTWMSSNPGVATVNPSGIITGISTGSSIITYVSALGCNATNNIVITVDEKTQKTISGDNTLCLGETTDLELNNNLGIGTWGVMNSNILTINQNGEVVTVAPGTTLITYTQANNVCGDTAFYAITVNPIPIITISGPTTICIGDQATSISSNISGGTWASSNTNVATISPTGLVTGVAGGQATFSYIASGTLCSSLPSTQITVRPAPTITLTGSPNLCIGSNAVLSSNIAGTWTTNNPSIATIGTTNGVITALSSGSATFNFTSTIGGCVTAAPQQINVADPMTVSIISGSACYVSNMSLSAQVSGGNGPFTYTWSGPSLNSTAISVTIGSAGSYNLIVESAYGCQTSTNKIILPELLGAILSADTVCQNTAINIKTNISGATYQWGGTAQNATDSVVSVIPSYPSTLYTVTVTNGQGCIITLNKTIQVYSKPIISFNGTDTDLCPGMTTSFSANVTGYWYSSNPSVATISNSGLVTAIDSGTVRFIFQNSATNCFSDSSIQLVVRKEPTITTDANGTLCVGATAQLNSNIAGTWINNNPTIASVSTTGAVTGLAIGMASFDFVAASGCQTSATFQIPVNIKPTVVLTGDSVLCIGETTQFFPATSGSWQTGNSSIATISNEGLVTAINGGSTKFVFVNSAGCISDSSKPILVNPKPPISVDGPNSICVGNKTQMTSSVAGQWEGLNNSVAIISSTGEVTGIASGNARFRFKSSLTNCYSNASEDITVLGRPIVNVLGQNILCIGATTILSPNNGGNWSSSNTAVAQVANNGQVTAIGPGSASFIFTNSITGCVSNETLPIQVQDKAPVSITGSDIICIGSTTQLLPDFGGVWESNDETVATVSNLGVVTGKKIGTTTFKFTPTSGCASNNTAPVTVGSSPGITINGPSALCVGDTSLMNPGFGGSWLSTNTAVATISNNGKITALAQGQARFIFTTSSGCVSLPSLPIIVNSPPPPPFIPRASLCIGDTMVLSPNVIGTWVTSNATVATVDNKGKVLALSSGQVRFRYTDDQTGCISELSGLVTINEAPVISGESNTLCLGSTMVLSPFTSGVWIPSDASIVGVSISRNIVTVLGKNAGTATISFTSSETGCVSSNQYPITVQSPISVDFNRYNLCIGDTTQIRVDNVIGSWSSLTPSIATISPAGIVTAKAKGLASFSFYQSNNGCVHTPPQNLNVLERPYVAVDGTKDICINGTAQLLPTSGGVWTSLNSSVAIISNTGLVNGVSAGTAYFRFVENGSGCTSDSSIHVNVGELSPPVFTGPSIVCLGYSGSLIAGVSQSIWSSSDAAIAKISPDGIFTGLAPGKVRFRFTDATNNCQSAFMPSSITIKNCIDPDFNVVGLNNKIYGSVATNDDIPGVSNFQNERGLSIGERTTTVRYGQPILEFKPLNSNSNLFVEESGAYSFITNTAGKYRYKIPVCINDEQFGCPTMLLELTAVDTKSPDAQYISNLDIGTIYGGNTTLYNTLANDKVLNGIGSQSINWSKGSSMSNAVTGSASMSYGASNLAGKYGMDTMNYSMCWPNPSIANCYASSQFMVVNAPSALNSVVAGDDFVTTPSATPVRFNVLANDMDPENNTITITPQGSEQSMINIPSGRYCVESNGDIVYVPSNGFYGSADIVYNICDNNLVNQECTKATAHILVLEDLRIKMRVYLEGALIGNNGAQSVGTGRPLMRDDLRYSTLNGKRSMPVQSPYKVNPFDTNVINLPLLYKSVNDESSRNSSIIDSNGVFGVTGENAIVDWVYVQIRNKADNKVVLATRSGLLQRDGDIVDLDGISDLSFTNVVADSFYIMVKHRNHLGVMSGLVVNGSMVDFTNPNTVVFNYGTTLNNGLDYKGLSMNAEVIQGYTALWAGDLNSDGLVKYTSPDDDTNIILTDVLLNTQNASFTTNYDFTIGYYQGDFNLNAKSKYDNPEDDTNYLFGQVILFPLNKVYLANFGLLLEQVPK